MHNLLNEYTDLSQRLEHLIAHSSQMVFVSGEHMGSQKDFVEAFLSTRQDDVDVLYITGNNFHGIEDVRNEFARQLLGQPPSLELSLIQLVSAREEKRHPLLIAVTRAERLPDQILQELWDLVLQNRFARNQQQINILLFGEQAWAEQTKAWLPTNNNDKPVLLTSETVAVQAEQEIEGDLESYIKAKREEFNDRLKARALAHEPPKSVWSNWWLRLLSVCVFIVCFSGILIWQYFDLSKSAIEEFSQFLLQQESNSEVPETNEWQEAKALLAETEALQVSPVDSVPEEQIAAATEQAETNALPEDQARVTNWQEASKRLDRQPLAVNLPAETNTATDSGTPQNAAPESDAFQNTANNSRFYESESLVQIPKEALRQLQPQVTTPTSSETQDSTDNIDQTSEQTASQAEPDLNSSESSEPPTVIASAYPQADPMGPPVPDTLQNNASTNISNSSDNSTTPIATETDYPVADIVSLDELPQASETTSPPTPPQTQTADESTTSESTTPQATVTETTEAAPTPITPNYEYSEAELLALPDSLYLLQISGISSKRVLDEYIVDNRLEGRVWIYKTRRYGGDWHVVVYKQGFNTLNEARDSVAQLPQTSRQSAPFAKSIAMIKEEIAQGYPQE